MANYEQLIKQLGKLQTEQPNPNSANIDLLDPLSITRLINSEDKTVAQVVETALPQLAQAAEIFARTFSENGRIIYVGAGTSGRLGVLDAAECPPTFGTDPKQIIGLISGGYKTLIMSKEGVEDDVKAAGKDLVRLKVGKTDFVIGLAASKRTPYTLGALVYAKRKKAATAFISCNSLAADEQELLGSFIDVIISLPVGSEVITGSTRMKSGTAQKMALNIISTTAMVLLGKTYGNLMVDLQAKSAKLAARSRKILMDMFTIDVTEAEKLLKKSGGSVKLALVMKKYNCDKKSAVKKLKEAGGFVRRIKE
ncbi:MAG TPA: N-acetylmuramic acid 6-phosphate etherase [candidate division Zixibacteria bacterium]|nr:N-acetylmuramic acid 6-phosphate etherase [candidate division Zixibacteria bacterium]